MEPRVDDFMGATKKVMEHLNNNEAEFISSWEEQLISSNDIHFKAKMKGNGKLLYMLVKETIEGEISDETVKDLAYKVVQERMDVGVNIGDFVYNINLGRSILTKYIVESGVSHEALSCVLDKINTQFNNFCYQVVSKYTMLKDLEIKEKTSFIQQTHKDRLAILGQISSSFVHEFRNPLTSVIGFNKLLKREFSSHPYLDIIEQELDQLNFRITQFLHTSRMKIDGKGNIYESLDLHELLDGILKFLYPSIVSNDVDVNTYYEKNMIIQADKEELKQVFLNILFNSIDAVKLNEQSRKIDVVCSTSDSYFKVKIINNGPQIPSSVRETIFEPFYTTKETGTGIGLFVCKKIVEKLEGSISCESDDQETIFSIQLPPDPSKLK